MAEAVDERAKALELSVVDSRIADVGWLCRNRSWIRHEGWLCRGWSVVAGRFEKLLGGGWVNGFLSR